VSADGDRTAVVSRVERLGVGLVLAYMDGDAVAATTIRQIAADEGADLLGFLAGLIVLLACDGVFDVELWREHALNLAVAS
jgi:hypothetical protein